MWHFNVCLPACAFLWNLFLSALKSQRFLTVFTICIWFAFNYKPAMCAHTDQQTYTYTPLIQFSARDPGFALSVTRFLSLCVCEMCVRLCLNRALRLLVQALWSICVYRLDGGWEIEIDEPWTHTDMPASAVKTNAPLPLFPHSLSLSVPFFLSLPPNLTHSLLLVIEQNILKQFLCLNKSQDSNTTNLSKTK